MATITAMRDHAESLRATASDFDADGMKATASDYRAAANALIDASGLIQKLTAQRDHARRHLDRIGESVENAKAGFDLDL